MNYKKFSQTLTDSSLNRKKIEITYTVSIDIGDVQVITESVDNNQNVELDQGSPLIQKILSPPVEGRNLKATDLSDRKPNCANMSSTDLSCADLSCTNLSNTNLSNVNLSYADLSGANLSYANLIRAHLIRADLSGADPSCADLSGTNLSCATVKNTRFEINVGLTEDIKLDLERRGAIFAAKEKDTSS